MKNLIVLIIVSLSVSLSAQKLQETRRFSTPQKVVIDGKMKLNLHKSNEVEVVINANGVELQDIYTKDKGDELLIRVEPIDIEGGTVVIDLYIPLFKELHLSRGAKTFVPDSFLENYAKISASTGAEIKGNFSKESLEAKSTSGAFIELAGKLKYLEAKVHSGGKIRTDSLNLQSAKLIARSGGFIAATPTEKVKIRACFGGEVKLLKNVSNIKTTKIFGNIDKSFDK